MKPRLLWTVLVLGAGCTAYIYNPDVIGPHGEHLIELACSTPDRCMDLARQTCGGDYDVVTTGNAVSGTSQGGTSSANLMLVQCKTSPVAAPGPPAGAARDAG
jgi:hypothetical protein